MSVLIAAALALCTQTVDLRGDDVARATLRSDLENHGVPLGEGTAECPALQIDVQRRDEALEVVRVDAAGRRDARTVHDPQLAVALIESWLHRDLAAPLLAFTPPGRPAERAPERPAAIAQQGTKAVSAMAELGRNDVGGWERGAALRAAAAIGAFAGETLLRYAAADPIGLDASRAGHWTAELLLGARLPLDLGMLDLAPGVAVGAALDGAERASCRGCGRVIADDAWAVKLMPRAEASLLGSLELGARFALEATCGASLTPFASDAPSVPAYAAGPGEEAFALAAPPRARLRAGLGLRWSAP